ncbi:MAG: phosphatase PAP2 family protein [Candidatus Dormibacteraeota bacterium]|nr:phosphatase PAP2 family protein [Candidatus Dormibacteraeota bacterium]
MSVMTRRLLLLGLLTLAFVALTQVVAAGTLGPLDLRVDADFSALRSTLGPLAVLAGRAYALLGGLEMTGLIVLGIGLYLWRRGFRREALVVFIYPISVLVEEAYKLTVRHPSPPPGRLDAPSLDDLLTGGGGIANSYPSGHMARSVLIYGLLAFVVFRLAPAGRARSLAVPAAIVIIAAMAFDRLFLGVHWESDVLGGLLLGAVLLVVAVAWLDRPVPEA